MDYRSLRWNSEDIQTIELLLTYGVNINQANNAGLTSIAIARKYNRDDIVKWLLEHGASDEADKLY